MTINLPWQTITFFKLKKNAERCPWTSMQGPYTSTLHYFHLPQSLLYDPRKKMSLEESRYVLPKLSMRLFAPKSRAESLRSHIRTTYFLIQASGKMENNDVSMCFASHWIACFLKFYYLKNAIFKIHFKMNQYDSIP